MNYELFTLNAPLRCAAAGNRDRHLENSVRSAREATRDSEQERHGNAAENQVVSVASFQLSRMWARRASRVAWPSRSLTINALVPA